MLVYGIIYYRIEKQQKIDAIASEKLKGENNMSKREKIKLVILVAVGVVMSRCKDEIRMIGNVLLVLVGIISIWEIVNIFITNLLLKYLIQDILVIKYMEQEKNNTYRSSLNITFDQCISNTQEDAKRCVEKLKQSKRYLSEKQYEHVLKLEEYLVNNANRKTGGL